MYMEDQLRHTVWYVSTTGFLSLFADRHYSSWTIPTHVSYSDYIGMYNVFFSQGSLEEQNVYSFQQESRVDGLAELRTTKGNLPATQKLTVGH